MLLGIGISPAHRLGCKCCSNLTVIVGKKWKVIEKSGRVVYDRASGKFAATTAKVSINDLWLGEVGVGQVTIKGVGTWPVTVE